jgi:hypothetical protein
MTSETLRVGVPFIGPLLSGGVMLYQHQQIDDVGAISTRFARTALNGQSVHINDEAQGAFYFPAEKLAALRIGYLRDGARPWLVLSPAGPTTRTERAEEASGVGPSTRPADTEAAPRISVDVLSFSEAQRRLARLGYNRGPADGVAGPITITAIRRFQGDMRLPVTGLLDSATNAALVGRR